MEEGEIFGEFLFVCDNCCFILIYEVIEGGVGVLSCLVDDFKVLGRVVREVFVFMYFKKVDEVIMVGDVKFLIDYDGEVCVWGCYCCLFFYFN